jgi:integrase
MPLKVVRRKSTGALTITGTVAGHRIQRRAASDRLALAEEEAAVLEAGLLRGEWHGERRGSRSFDEALESYLNATPHHENTKRRLRRIRDALGDVKLSEVDQDTIIRLRLSLSLPGSREIGPATILREIITPLRSVLHHAQHRGWCDPVYFETPRVVGGRTVFMLPGEAGRLVAAAAPHIKPLVIFMVCTGARLSEAIYLDWRDVDLKGGRVIFWETKNGKRRVASLPFYALVSIAALPQRTGGVFLSDRNTPYVDRGGEYGGQIKTAWRGAIRRSGLNPEFSPHTCRHTWASWHYAIHRDLLRLKVEGGWSSTALVERYAHLMPVGHEAEIRTFWGCDDAVTDTRGPRLTA